MERIIVTIEKDWLSVADICEYMDVSAFVVTNQLRAGGLPAVKFGREWRVARQDFEDWINEQRAESASSSLPTSATFGELS
jgi:excisionase family DNA binding protein